MIEFTTASAVLPGDLIVCDWGHNLAIVVSRFEVTLGPSDQSAAWTLSPHLKPVPLPYSNCHSSFRFELLGGYYSFIECPIDHDLIVAEMGDREPHAR